MSYFENLNSDQLKNIGLLISEMKRQGITNKYAQAGMLAVMSKESNFSSSWLEERSYRSTPASSIRRIFGSRVGMLSDSQINSLKLNDVAFFNHVYGCRYDTPCNAGFRYRGRGFNGITFVGNYRRVSPYAGVDLVKNPEKLKDPRIASRSAVGYFVATFKDDYSSAHAQHYNAKNINDFKNVQDSVLAMYHANAGFGKPMFTTSSITSTSGLRKALSRVTGFNSIVASMVGSMGTKKKVLGVVIALVVLAVVITGTILIFRSASKDKK